jgi:hypothetical protein
MVNSSTLVLMPMMTMASCRVVLRGEGVEKDPESTTPSWRAGFSNQVCAQFAPRMKSDHFMPRACLFAFMVLKQRVNQAKKAE